MSYPCTSTQELRCIQALPSTIKVTCISFSSDGLRVAVGCSDGKIFIYLTETLNQCPWDGMDEIGTLQAMSTNGKEIKCISWSHLKPRRIAVGYIDETRIHIYSVTTEQDLNSLIVPEPVRLTLLRRDNNPLYKFSTYALLHVHHRQLQQSNEVTHKALRCFNCEDVLAGCANGYLTCWSLPNVTEKAYADQASLEPVWKIRVDPISSKATPIVSLEHMKSTFSATGATLSFVVMAASADGLLTFWECFPSSASTSGSATGRIGKVKLPVCLRQINTHMDLIGATLLLYDYHACESCTLRAEQLEKKSRKVRSTDKQHQQQQQQRVRAVLTPGQWPNVLVTGKTGQLIVYSHLDTTSSDLSSSARWVSEGVGATVLPATLTVREPSHVGLAYLAAREEDRVVGSMHSNTNSKSILLPLTHSKLLMYGIEPNGGHHYNYHYPAYRYTQTGNINTDYNVNDTSQLVCITEAVDMQFTALSAHPTLSFAVAGARGKGIMLLNLRHNNSNNNNNSTNGNIADSDATSVVAERKPFERVNCSMNMSPISYIESCTVLPTHQRSSRIEASEIPVTQRNSGSSVLTLGWTKHMSIGTKTDTTAHSSTHVQNHNHTSLIPSFPAAAEQRVVGKEMSKQVQASPHNSNHVYNTEIEKSNAFALAKRKRINEMDTFVIESIYKQTRQSNRKKRYRKLFVRDEKIRISNHS